MRESDIQGIRDAARFAIQPNMKGLCGEKSDQQLLRDIVSGRSHDHELARDILTNHGFPHLNAFLETIADISDLGLFDDEVVMSYWMGSFLTDNVGVNTKGELIGQYSKQMSGDFAKALEQKLPEKIFLTHLSQVALIAAEGYEQEEKTKLINHCMVGYGKIVDLDFEKRVAVVMREMLRKRDCDGYGIILGKQTVKIDSDLTPDLSVGDEIAVHLGYLATKLEGNQAQSLRYWTRKVAAII